MSKPPKESPGKIAVRLPWLPGALLLCMVVLAYLPALRAGFIWDDDRYVTENPLLTAPDGLWQIWFSTHSQSQYFPLVYTTFRLEHALWGLNPIGYHLVNVLLHGVNAVLVWRLLKRLAVPGAWLAAAIFALHPVQVETVAWVTELKNVESTLFYLLAVGWWLKSCEEQGRRAWMFYGLMMLSYLLALFAKTTACTFPAAMVLALWLRRKPIGWRQAAQIAPVVLVGIGMGLVSVWWERHLGNYGEQFGLHFSLAEKLLIASRAVWFYACKLAWPANLMFSYPRWELNPREALQYLWLAGCLAAAGVLWWKRDKVGRSVLAGVVFFVAALSPLIGFIPNYTFQFSFVADHYQYLASLGLIAIFSAGAVKLAATRLDTHMKGWLAALLLVVLGALTWQRAGVYRGAPSVWRDTVAKNPTSWIAHNNLAVCLYGTGEHAQALEHFQRALELNPDSADTHNDYAVVLEQERRYDEAADHYARAVALEPGFAVAHYNFGVLKARRGNTEAAIQDFARALAIQPRLGKAQHAWGLALARQGSVAEAVVHYRLAVDLEPAVFANHFDLGNALLALGQLDEAIGSFGRALAIDARSPGAWVNLGRAQLLKGRPREAIAAMRQALAIDPKYVPALNNLAGAYYRQGALDQAAECFRVAIEADPADPELRYNLGRLLERQARPAEARRQYGEALRLRPDFPEARRQLEALSGGNTNTPVIR